MTEFKDLHFYMEFIENKLGDIFRPVKLAGRLLGAGPGAV